MYDLTVAERHVPEMLASLDHAHDWKRCHRAANVRDHEQLCRSSPGALQADIVEADPDQLRDFWGVIINVGKKLEHELRGLQAPARFRPSGPTGRLPGTAWSQARLARRHRRGCRSAPLARS